MKKYIIRKNPVIWWVIVFCLIVTSVLGFIACYFAYSQKKMEILLELDSKLAAFADEFSDVVDRNWENYLPVTKNTRYSLLMNEYFVETEQSATPQLKKKLKEMLNEMALRDSRIQWIVLYTPERKHNYIYIREDYLLMELPENFVYLEELKNKEKTREIFAKKEFEISKHSYRNIAIAGGTPTKNKNGSILIGYDINRLEQIAANNTGISSLQFCVSEKEENFFNSRYETESIPWQGFKPDQSGTYKINGTWWQIRVADKQMTGETVFYMVKCGELFVRANQWSGIILGILFFAMVLFMFVYNFVVKSLTSEVKVILDGLTVISHNQLDYKISEKFHQPEMSVIADTINQMAKDLKYNIERVHTFEKLQTEAEYAELQAKFNPHFLYNTLEIFRRRCYQNGDEETANLIAETAAIFRGFIGAEKFIPIRNELSFCKRYMSVYHARYGDAVKITFDIDSEVLQYGVIRNVFQPLIENYFEHGYDSERTDNYIQIRGKMMGDKGILFTVEDNGRGMDETALEKLQQNLNQPIVTEKESYGLKNLNQRLRLFYGDGYGLSVYRGEEDGIVIEILVKRQKYTNSKSEVQ